MKGIARLLEVRRRQTEVQTKLVAAAQEAAGFLATTLAQDCEFKDLKLCVVRAGATYVVTFGDLQLPHPRWTYQEAREFAAAIQGGLIDRVADELEKVVAQEEATLAGMDTKAVSSLEISPPPPDNTSLEDEIAADMDLIGALQMSHDDIPTLSTITPSASILKEPPKPKAPPTGVRCDECHSFFGIAPTEAPRKCPNCGKSNTLKPASTTGESFPES